MSKHKKSYHHGDLRPALLNAAIALIGAQGLSGWSLRECARRAGVSHAAPGRHFADKDALLAAIAEQGFEKLAERGAAAMVAASTPRDALDAYGAAYVRFALEHPVHFRVMFTAELDKQKYPDEKHGVRAFELLREAARRVAGTSQDDLTPALAAWSLPHGLAMLILDGRIPREQVPTPEAAEALARATFALWRGPLAGS